MVFALCDVALVCEVCCGLVLVVGEDPVAVCVDPCVPPCRSPPLPSFSPSFSSVPVAVGLAGVVDWVEGVVGLLVAVEGDVDEVEEVEAWS